MTTCKRSLSSGARRAASSAMSWRLASSDTAWLSSSEATVSGFSNLVISAKSLRLLFCRPRDEGKRAVHEVLGRERTEQLRRVDLRRRGARGQRDAKRLAVP